MSRGITETHFCDFCEKELKVREPERYVYGKRVTEKNGVCITLGYSQDGWGLRRDIMPKFSSEDICDKCFVSFKEKAEIFWESLHAKHSDRKEADK